jgi:tripartite ATP-independent transporter DctP family solute receptor
MVEFSRRTVARGLFAGGAGLAIPAISRSALAAPTTLVLSHHLPTSHLVHKTSERYAALVAQATGGQVTVDIKPNGQLFNLRTAAEALRLGTLDLCWSDLGTLGNWRPEFGFISLPFLMSGFEHARKVLYGAVGQQVRTDANKALGIEILSLGASGFRVFLGNRVIRTVDDCKGMKLRVPEVPVYVDMARAIGANPTPIPADGIYTALQTHVVDEMENPPDYLVDVKLWEVGKNATRTNHIFTEVSLMSGARKMAGLPPEVQKALREAAKQAVEVEMWATNLTNQEAAWTELAAHTQAVGDPDLASFRARTKPVVDAFLAKNAAARSYVDGVAAAG